MRKGTKENRELAFRLYKEEQGRNIGLILRRFEAESGVRLSARTLHKWKNEGGWEERLADEGPATLDEKILGRLMRLMEKYERRMEDGERPDDQSTYAYLYLVKTARELSKTARKKDPKEWRRSVEEVLGREYGVKKSMA